MGNLTAPLPQAEHDRLAALFNGGRHGELEILAHRLTERHPENGYVWMMLGLSLQLQGKEALPNLEKAAELAPEDAEVQCNLGNVQKERGRYEAAQESYRRALEIDPGYALAHYNLGHTLEIAGQSEAAVESYRNAVQAQANFIPAHYNLGNNLRTLGRLEEAAGCYRQVLRLDPGYAPAHNNLGCVLRDLGQLDDATLSFRRALQINPLDAVAYNNLGNVLWEAGQTAEALENCRRALEIAPDFADAHNNLGNVLRDLRRLDEAVASYLSALELQPGYAGVHSNLGVARQDLGLLDEAIASFRRALEYKPDYAEAYSNLLLALNYQTEQYDEEIRAACREFERRFGCHDAQPHRNVREVGRRLRVGYVSPDFRRHAAAYFAEPILAQHDHTQIEIYCYAEVKREDDTTARFRRLADHWYNSVGLSDAALAQLIRDHQIDILVDLAGHSRGNRLPVFARKPAPVQLTYLGFAGSTGLSAMDYRLTDRHTDPEGESEGHYTETLLRLPDSLWCYRPSADMPAVGPLPALTRGHLTFGSFNNYNKIDPATLTLWSALLRALPDSRLMMLTVPAGATRQRLLQEFAGQGIGSERLELHGPLAGSEFQRKYLEADIALDPVTVNGGTTTCESLWMGVPVISLTGKRFLSRAGLSLLSSAGLTDFAVATEEEYIRLAAHLGANLALLAEIRGGLRAHLAASPLTDEAGFTRNLENLYREIWGKWCRAS